MISSRGFVILAQNTVETDYVLCAVALAKSIKRVMSDSSITLISNSPYVKSNCIDNVIPLPHGDLDESGKWKLVNDWQVYEASPYDYTIKLEADMYIPKSIDYWWDILQHRDVVISHTIRDFKGVISNNTTYRRFTQDNNLPNCYNAITYFKKSDTAKQFFEIVRNVFENWNDYKTILKCNPLEKVSTDWAYSIACHILGKEKTLLPGFDEMSMVHMKQYINGLLTENWTDTLVYEVLPDKLRINSYTQSYPFHYHIKSFADKLLTNI